MESRIGGRVCFASILTLSLIRLDRGTALWRTPTVAANDTPLLTQIMSTGVCFEYDQGRGPTQKELDLAASDTQQVRAVEVRLVADTARPASSVKTSPFRR